MRLLFLDLDGVLNGHEKLSGSEYCGIRPDCMARLNRIITEVQGLKLILTSAWRYMIHGDAMNLIGMEYLLFTHGLVADRGTLFDITVADEIIGKRENQIFHMVSLYHPVKAWAVLDDLPLKFGENYQGRFVQTDGTKGLTDADADKVIEILRKKT